MDANIGGSWSVNKDGVGGVPSRHPELRGTVMASTGQKIATGCGIGCLLLVLVVGGVGTCSYLGIKKVVDEAESIDVVYDDLTTRFGPPGEYTPAADGRIGTVQMELFLSVRDTLLARGAEAERILATLDGAEGRPTGPIAKIRAGMDFIPAMIRFVAAHSGTLMDQGMGLGEYAYLYTLSYYVLLDRDPGAGPDFELEGDPGEAEGQVRWEFDTEGGTPQQDRARTNREAVNRLMRRILTNQRDAAELAGEDPDWIAALDREITSLEIDPERLPWQDGLPDRLATSLAPYRSRLEATWSPYLNALELDALRR
ncbi:hypothetical protein GF314_05555 [bacterium]|nr:hypothetical protein [bacterium]